MSPFFSMSLFRSIALFLLLQCYLFNGAFAQAMQQQGKQAHSLKEITQICLTSAIDCLQSIDDVLVSVHPKSRLYFEVLQYKLEALFNLKHREQLNQETEQWLNHPNLPLTFQVTNAIYFAKSSWELNKVDKANEAYLFALSLLKQVNSEFPSPLRLVQFANLQMQLEEYDEAYQLMLGLAEKYPNSPDTRFMVELHGNLGHAANKMKQPKQALIHWQATTKWARLFDDKQQLGVVFFNLADIYEQLQQYDAAFAHFTDAINYSKAANDKVKMHEGKLRLLKVKLLMGPVCKNDPLFTSINKKYLPKMLPYTYHSDLAELTKKLKSCQL